MDELKQRIAQLEQEVRMLKGKPTEADLAYGFNGGTPCDNLDGPCSCGAWHTPDSPPPNLTTRGREAIRNREQKEREVLRKLAKLL